MPVQLSLKIKSGMVRQGLEELTEEAPKVGRLRIYRTMQAIRKRMKREPGPFRGRYPWKSEKQRRYVMMMISRGLIKVPRPRTHRYSRGWRIEKTEYGYMLRNRTPYSKWVGGSAYGTNQARIHRGRWPLLRNEFDAEIQRLPEEIADQVVVVARREGFVTK